MRYYKYVRAWDAIMHYIARSS